MYFALCEIRRWRLPATPDFTLPEAVMRKRFLAPDLVFSLGILCTAGLKPPSFFECSTAPLLESVESLRPAKACLLARRVEWIHTRHTMHATQERRVLQEK